MKLIIQIPCYNEEESLPSTLAELPRVVPGFDIVEWLVIDDGSKDQTVAVALNNKVDHVVRLTKNQGLATAFIEGIRASVSFGADVIVNTDADNQYCADDIPKLVSPILEGTADIVIGERPISEIQHFSAAKKFFQKMGSMSVRLVSNTTIPDAPSGFRAYSREAALKLQVFNNYTYTVETIIQAGQKNMAITSVPIRVNGETRPSRLFRSVFSYIRKSTLIMIRAFIIYRPFRFLVAIGSFLFLLGVILGGRFLIYYFMKNGSGHVQSLILSSVLLGIGFQTLLAALLADLLSVNRRLLEGIDYLMRKNSADK